MKFDVFAWNEIAADKPFRVSEGRVRLMCSEAAVYYAEGEGVEAIAGHGHSLDITSAEPLTITVVAPKGARLFLHGLGAASFEPVGEVFTNIDRKPQESGSVLEVKRALREFKVEQMGLKREMREERLRLERARRALHPGPVRQEPVEPVSDPVEGADDVAE